MIGRTRMPLAIGLAALLGASVVSPSAEAQTPPAGRWALIEQEGATAALVRFSSGIDIMVRCRGETLDALIAGLPPTTGRRRELRRSGADDPVQSESWLLAEDPAAAFSEVPARFARSLREGGPMNVVVPGAGANGRNLRYVLDIPSDTAAIDTTLAACGRPVVDPRDDLVELTGDGSPPGGLGWETPPRPVYPEGFATYDWGFASLSCLTKPDGSLEQCQVEAQNPPNGPFGASALRATRNARLQVTEQPDAPVPRRVIVFSTRFDMAPVDGPPPMRPRSHP